jgi:L-asparaginase / beta-aspartyl-peptidase
MFGAGAERLAHAEGIATCTKRELVAPRALARWRAWRARQLEGRPVFGRGGRARQSDARAHHGTVGAAALDARGAFAAATSTGGYTGKLPGRIGDSAICGAGFFASSGLGAASATGLGEAIIEMALCRGAVTSLRVFSADKASVRAIESLSAFSAQGGIIIVDRRGRVGYAHNAEQMDVATFEASRGVRYEMVKPQVRHRER